MCFFNSVSSWKNSWYNKVFLVPSYIMNKAGKNAFSVVSSQPELPLLHSQVKLQGLCSAGSHCGTSYQPWRSAMLLLDAVCGLLWQDPQSFSVCQSITLCNGYPHVESEPCDMLAVHLTHFLCLFWQKVSPWTPSHDLQDWPSSHQSILQLAKHQFCWLDARLVQLFHGYTVLQKTFSINNYWTCKSTVAWGQL